MWACMEQNDKQREYNRMQKGSALTVAVHIFAKGRAVHEHVYAASHPQGNDYAVGKYGMCMLARADVQGSANVLYNSFWYAAWLHSAHTILIQLLGVLLALRFGDELCVKVKVVRHCCIRTWSRTSASDRVTALAPVASKPVLVCRCHNIFCTSSAVHTAAC